LAFRVEGAEDIATGAVEESTGCAEDFALGSLAAAGRAEKRTASFVGS
jgi:hypothetical protein